jgi:hypothetical protein
MVQWLPSEQFHCPREGIIVFVIKLHGTSLNHELVVYAWFPCACKCLCMRSTRTPFLTVSHELIFRLMGLTIALPRASMICLQMKHSRLSTLLCVVSNMERNVVNNMSTQYHLVWKVSWVSHGLELVPSCEPQCCHKTFLGPW